LLRNLETHQYNPKRQARRQLQIHQPNRHETCRPIEGFRIQRREAV
jgi:hypothetical protein